MKKKTVISIIVIVLLALCALYLGYNLISKASHKNTKPESTYPPENGKEVYEDGTIDSVVYRHDTTFYYFTDGHVGFSVK